MNKVIIALLKERLTEIEGYKEIGYLEYLIVAEILVELRKELSVEYVKRKQMQDLKMFMKWFDSSIDKANSYLYYQRITIEYIKITKSVIRGIERLSTTDES